MHTVNNSDRTVITIGMPVYNDVLFLEKSINSILNQSFRHFQLIISDDGSSDGSDIICIKYAQIDNRVKYIRQEKNLGISKNMEFLLALANTEYFMWAGDDDLWHPDFIKILIGNLRKHQKAISSFTLYNLIDEKDNIIGIKNHNYSNARRISRLSDFVKNADDGFGYGIFVTEKIKQVQFPIWWWPNKNCPLNNIFPSLCYYLAKGDYVHNQTEPLFYKRVKSQALSNYNSPYYSNGIKDTFAFILRRFYLVFFSAKMITKGRRLRLAFILFPLLLIYWFLIPSYKQIKLLFHSFIRRFNP